MEIITKIWSWLVAHYQEIITVWIGIIGIAEVIVKWTDTKKDDAILGKVRAFGVWVISILTKFGLETPKKA